MKIHPFDISWDYHRAPQNFAGGGTTWQIRDTKKFETNLEQRGIEVMAPILVAEAGFNLVWEEAGESTGAWREIAPHPPPRWLLVRHIQHRPPPRPAPPTGNDLENGQLPAPDFLGVKCQVLKIQLLVGFL